jgi:hypothetical protein
MALRLGVLVALCCVMRVAEAQEPLVTIGEVFPGLAVT